MNQEKNDKQNKRHLIIFSVFLIAILVIITLLTRYSKTPEELGAENSNNEKVVFQEEESVNDVGEGKEGEEEETTEEVDTSNWLTYRNEEYGFEVRYPEEFYLFEKNDTIHLQKPEYVNTLVPPSYSIDYRKFDNKINLKNRETTKKYLENYLDYLKFPNKDFSFTFVNDYEVLVSGLDYVKYNYFVFIPEKNLKLVIYGPDSQLEFAGEEFKTIIDSIK